MSNWLRLAKMEQFTPIMRPRRRHRSLDPIVEKKIHITTTYALKQAIIGFHANQSRLQPKRTIFSAYILLCNHTQPVGCPLVGSVSVTSYVSVSWMPFSAASGLRTPSQVAARRGGIIRITPSSLGSGSCTVPSGLTSLGNVCLEVWNGSAGRPLSPKSLSAAEGAPLLVLPRLNWYLNWYFLSMSFEDDWGRVAATWVPVGLCANEKVDSWRESLDSCTGDKEFEGGALGLNDLAGDPNRMLVDVSVLRYGQKMSTSSHRTLA